MELNVIILMSQYFMFCYVSFLHPSLFCFSFFSLSLSFWAVWRFVIPGTTSPCVRSATAPAATGSLWRHVAQLEPATCLTTQPQSSSPSSWPFGVRTPSHPTKLTLRRKWLISHLWMGKMFSPTTVLRRYFSHLLLSSDTNLNPDIKFATQISEANTQRALFWCPAKLHSHLLAAAGPQTTEVLCSAEAGVWRCHCMTAIWIHLLLTREGTIPQKQPQFQIFPLEETTSQKQQMAPWTCP